MTNIHDGSVGCLGLIGLSLGVHRTPGLKVPVFRALDMGTQGDCESTEVCGLECECHRYQIRGIKCILFGPLNMNKQQSFSANFYITF